MRYEEILDDFMQNRSKIAIFDGKKTCLHSAHVVRVSVTVDTMHGGVNSGVNCTQLHTPVFSPKYCQSEEPKEERRNVA